MSQAKTGRMIALALCVAFLLAALPGVGRSEILINEYLPSNTQGILDEDGDTSDWIELYNTGPEEVELFNCGLTDDPDDPYKWQLPKWDIRAGEHLLIFASSKDRLAQKAYWDTVVMWGDLWRYRANATAPPEDWWEDGFDDSSWSEGPSGFGFGDGDDATLLPPCLTASLRRTVVVSDTTGITHLCFHIDYDDAFVVYLNGEELFREGIYYTGDPPWDLPATISHEAAIYRGGVPETYLIPDVSGLLRPGDNTLAIQVHNTSLSSDDLSMIPILSVGRSEPTGGAGPDPFVQFLLPHLHTNFKIDRQGEQLMLSAASGAVFDSMATDSLPQDISKGRAPDGSETWHYFSESTPESPNGTGGGVDFAPAVQFSPDPGFYAAPVLVTLWTDSPGAEIHYTLDGAEPSEGSALYGSPIAVDTTTVIRARSFESGYLPSPISSRTYIVDEATDLPVFSLATDPPNLWDTDTGIYILGENADPEYPHHGANYWEDWERPVHVEFFETDGITRLRQEMGMKIHGGWTRTYPQKALRLIADEDYGPPEMAYPFFDEKDIETFTRLILRNAGNDWCLAHLRDALQQRLAAPTGVGYQAYSPSVVYLNGVYWGIHNIRERLDARFLADNYGVDPDNVDLLRDQQVVMEGSAGHYLAMLGYIETNGLEDDEDFAYIESQMEVDDFATYYLTRIWFANNDWPGGNIRYWRPDTPNGRWRWLLQDMDWGIGFYVGPYHNTLSFALEPDGPDWPNPPWSTFLMRSLLENEAFRYRFINRYADHMNSTFLPSVTTPVAEAVMAGIEMEIATHMERWGFTLGIWEEQTEEVLEFLELRTDPARQHVIDEFGLDGLYTLTLDVYPPESGTIALTAIDIGELWSGTYFKQVPMTLSAIPAPGYQFLQWSDDGLPLDPVAVIEPDDDYTLSALFGPAPLPADAVVINEINYNSEDDVDVGDWIELYNNAEVTADLEGWVFKDEEDAHNFEIPPGVEVPPGGFLVLCEDSTLFRAVFPNDGPLCGEFDFGLSGGGELIRLFDSEGAIHDSLTYDDDEPWPSEPDGLGPTLELISAGFDNALPQSWAASTGYGTPGTINSAYVLDVDPGEEDGSEQAPWSLSLARPAPNPGGDRVHIRLTLDRMRGVDLQIYDVAGRRVRKLAGGMLQAGPHDLVWDGRTDGGWPASPGVYFVRLETEDLKQSRKFLIIE